MELYFGTKRVNPKEQIGARNTTLPIRIRTLEPRPLHNYAFLIINITKNALTYIKTNDLKTKYTFEEGKYGIYYFINTPKINLTGGINDFTDKYPLTIFGDMIAKYAFFVVQSIVTPETFDLLFPTYLPIEVRRALLNNDSFSRYDIEEICQVATTKKINLCDYTFYAALARQRLNKSEQYWVSHPETNIIKTMIDFESTDLIITSVTANYPIVLRKYLFIDNTNIVAEFAKYLIPMVESVPIWAYREYVRIRPNPRMGRPSARSQRVEKLNILLEAVFPSIDGEGGDTIRFNKLNDILTENDRVWDWIIEHLSDEDFNAGLEWAVNTKYLSLLEKFLQYLSPEDQGIYLDIYHQRPLRIYQYDLRTQNGLVRYLRDILKIDNDTLREHGLVLIP